MIIKLLNRIDSIVTPNKSTKSIKHYRFLKTFSIYSPPTIRWTDKAFKKIFFPIPNCKKVIDEGGSNSHGLHRLGGIQSHRANSLLLSFDKL